MAKSPNLAVEVIHTRSDGSVTRIENPSFIGYSTDRCYPFDQRTVNKIVKYMHTYMFSKGRTGRVVKRTIDGGAMLVFEDD